MPEQAADPLMSRAEAQAYLRQEYRLRVRLAHRACSGDGPTMLRFAGTLKVFYRKSELDRWTASLIRVSASTKDAGRPLTARELAKLMGARSAA